MSLQIDARCQITKLELAHYRNFNHFSISPEKDKILITGYNGAGKSNLLEAISLFSPGRGFRGTKYNDITTNSSLGQPLSLNYWTAIINLNSANTTAQIITTYQYNALKRKIQLNGSNINNAELLNLLNIIWITPQIEGVFQAGSTPRRKLLDRIVYLFDANHAERTNKYEYYLRERMILLKKGSNQSKWLGVIEDYLAKLALEITKCRCEVIQSLQQWLGKIECPFPQVELNIECKVAYLYKQQHSNMAELVSDTFRNARTIDSTTGKNSFGTHRADFQVLHAGKRQLAQYCSTGEQKALLVSLLIAQTLQAHIAYQRYPILLLDELFIHLDHTRRQYLAKFLSELPIQCWISSTERSDLQLFDSNCYEIKLS